MEFVESFVQLYSRVTCGETCDEDVYIGLNGFTFFEESVKKSYHVFVDDFDAVNDLLIILNETKEIRGFGASGDFRLVWSLSKFSPEGIQH